MTGYKVEPIAQHKCKTGENPLWDTERQRLYWTDIPTGRLFQFDHATGKHEQIYEGDPVGGFTLQEDGRLLLFRVKDIAIRHDNGKVDSLMPFKADGVPRFNDVIAAPDGSVLAGTMGRKMKGGVFHLTVDRKITNLWQGTNCSNGMAFTADRRRFFWTNTTTRTIYLHDYDAKTGAITNRKPLVEAPESGGSPDGMTLDAEGHLYSARWGGRGVFIYSADGSRVGKIDIPVDAVSSCVFGGPGMDELYVTTAMYDEKRPDAGTLYRMTGLGAKGVPEFRSKIAVD